VFGSGEAGNTVTTWNLLSRANVIPLVANNSLPIFSIDVIAFPAPVVLMPVRTVVDVPAPYAVNSPVE